ncbi:unnamed protein product, partial [Prorocentrum cordatum]
MRSMLRGYHREFPRGPAQARTRQFQKTQMLLEIRPTVLEVAAPGPASRVLPPKAFGAGGRGCWQPPPAALWRSLRLLQRLLASLPRERRQSAIRDFSGRVRG